MVIHHFWQFSEILNLNETSKWPNVNLHSSLLTIKFSLSTLKFSKLQIWQSVFKISQFLQNTAKQKLSFCPLSKGLQESSLMGHKSKSTNWIRLKICILYTHTKVNHWLYFTQYLTLFSSIDHHLHLYARFLILFHLT